MKREHFLPAQCLPIIYLPSVGEKECVSKINSLSVHSPTVLLFQDITDYTRRKGGKRKERKGELVLPSLSPSPLMFPIPRGHLLPGYSTSSGIRETPMLGWGRKSSSAATTTDERRDGKGKRRKVAY